MDIEIASVPFRVTLFGYRGLIKDGIVHASAKPLMDKMWQEVQDRRIKTTGINHWVYLPDSMIFTGIELQEPTTDVGTLETFGWIVMSSIYMWGLTQPWVQFGRS